MVQLDKLLQKEITRKQFIIASLSSIAGLAGISTFLGLFTKNLNQTSTRPGYGKQDYGP